MTIVFGGHDKTAILSLAGMGWLIWDKLSSPQVDWMQGQPWLHNGVIIALAFIGGAAFGSLLSHGTMRRLCFQKDLLSLALAHMDSGIDGCDLLPEVNT